MSIRTRLIFGIGCALAAAGMMLAQGPQHAVPYPRVDNASSYKVDPAWPREKPQGGDWAAMSSVAIAPDGNIWTLNRGKIPVQVFSPDGKLVKSGRCAGQTAPRLNIAKVGALPRASPHTCARPKPFRSRDEA